MSEEVASHSGLAYADEGLDARLGSIPGSSATIRTEFAFLTWEHC